MFLVFIELLVLRSQPYTTALEKRSLRKRAYKSLIETSCSNRILGGYCGGVPPLPIPNREVKPTSADGTAMQCGRVGNRLLLEESSETKVLGLFFYVFFLKKTILFFYFRTLRPFACIVLKTIETIWTIFNLLD